MKLTGEVIGVTTNGDSITVECQTSTEGEATWRRLGNTTISLPAYAKNGKTFYVGRRVVINVEPA